MLAELLDLSIWAHSENWIALATLLALEIVLGIDNIIFISILADRLPEEQRPKARNLGLGLAMLTRIGFVFSISLILRLKSDLFTVLGEGISGKDLILIAGGLFLLGKATYEIHHKIEGENPDEPKSKAASFAGVLTQILLLDLVFSIDSVVTAVGMTEHIAIMVIAIVVSVGVMLAFAGLIGRFVSAHPTVKVLALSFLLLIGLSLIAEGTGFHIPKGYIYFAMGFSIFVEAINLVVKRKRVSAAGGERS